MTYIMIAGSLMGTGIALFVSGVVFTRTIVSAIRRGDKGWIFKSYQIRG